MILERSAKVGHRDPDLQLGRGRSDERYQVGGVDPRRRLGRRIEQLGPAMLTQEQLDRVPTVASSMRPLLIAGGMVREGRESLGNMSLGSTPATAPAAD